jgi:dephospho-CoA kinase
VAKANAIRIGLTGGIGSGKSTVATFFRQVGAAVIDTDRIARDLTGPRGAAIELIAAAFGSSVIDGEGALDRSRMRAVVFADVPARKRLEAILHPMIATETERQAAAAASLVTIFDVPLLVESSRWPRLVHQIWVVDCEESTQVARVMMRSGWNELSVRGVMAQQATRRERRGRADTVIYNDGIDLPELFEHLDRIWASCRPAGTRNRHRDDVS